MGSGRRARGPAGAQMGHLHPFPSCTETTWTPDRGASVTEADTRAEGCVDDLPHHPLCFPACLKGFLIKI